MTRRRVLVSSRSAGPSPLTKSPMPSTKTEPALLDANVLIALSVTDHEHHRVARSWLGSRRPFATCPITQGSLCRFLARVSSVDHAVQALRVLSTNPRHRFWPDAEAYDEFTLRGVVGHRQVTDAYLAQRCADRGARLATFDRGLAVLRPDCVELIAVPR